MGMDYEFAMAYAKAQMGASQTIPEKGRIFVSLRDNDKEKIIKPLKALNTFGFKIIATTGTQRTLNAHGIEAEKVNKVLEGRPHIVDAIKNGDVQLVINTTEGAQALQDSRSLRRAALMAKVPYYTTLAGALAAIEAMQTVATGQLKVTPLQSFMA